MNVTELNDLSGRIIAAAIEVHRALGPGLLEHSYHTALMKELELQGMRARSEVIIPFIYKGVVLDTAYRADIIVENEIILELKATENDSKLFARQLLTYLRIADKRLGLLINFNHKTLYTGINRVVNDI